MSLYSAKLREKTAETWCGELNQLRKFLFFWDQRELQGKEGLYILVRMESGVETGDYCWKSDARIQIETKGGNEITSFRQEKTEALDRIIAAE